MTDSLLERVAVSVWNAAPDALLVVDKQGRIVLANPRAEQLFGYENGELEGEPVERLVPEASRLRHRELRESYAREPVARLMGSPAAELEGCTRAGNILPVEVALSPLTHEERPLTVAIVRDVRRRRELEERLRYLGTHDALTGLYNRAFFEAEMERLSRGRRIPIGLIVLDVDGLKALNDQRGHAAGDALLTATARVLRSAVRSEDVVARVGGDEFVVVLPLVGTTTLEDVIGRIDAAVRKHNDAHPELPVCMSLGTAVAETADAIRLRLEEADSNMYEDKRSRKKESLGG